MSPKVEEVKKEDDDEEGSQDEEHRVVEAPKAVQDVLQKMEKKRAQMKDKFGKEGVFLSDEEMERRL